MELSTALTAVLLQDLRQKDWQALHIKWGLSPKHLELLHNTPAERIPSIIEKSVGIKIDSSRLGRLLQVEHNRQQQQQMLDELLLAGAPNSLLRDFGDERTLAMRAAAIGAKRQSGRPRGMDTHEVGQSILNRLTEDLDLVDWLNLHKETGIQIRDLMQIQREVRDGKC